MAADAGKGQLEAHTPGAAAAIGAADAQAQGDAAALVEGSPDLLAIGGLAAAAETVAVQRRGRGRPPGALNKRNDSLIAYLQALGHRDPAVTLSMWQTADTRELAKALGLGGSAKGLAQVAALQVKAAAELLPYFYAKKPQQLELPKGGEGRPFMVIGEMTVNQLVSDGGFMTAGEVPGEKANEINGSAVRTIADDPHDKGK